MEVAIKELFERACFRHGRHDLAFVNEAKNKGLALRDVPHFGGAVWRMVWRHLTSTTSAAERPSSLRAGTEFSRTDNRRSRLLLRISGRFGWLISDPMTLFVISVRALACILEVSASPSYQIARVSCTGRNQDHRFLPTRSAVRFANHEFDNWVHSASALSCPVFFEILRQVAEDGGATTNLVDSWTLGCCNNLREQC